MHHSFQLFEQLVGSMKDVLNHTHSIALYVYEKMSAMTHSSGISVCKIYCETDFQDNTKQGPVINFNLLRANGEFVGYGEVCNNYLVSFAFYFFLFSILYLGFVTAVVFLVKYLSHYLYR